MIFTTRAVYMYNVTSRFHWAYVMQPVSGTDIIAAQDYTTAPRQNIVAKVSKFKSN